MSIVPSDQAIRTDRVRGIRETAAFVGAIDDRIYVCLHEPLEDLRGAVLVCPSLHAEMSSNYRREVLLARRLAESGVAVLRFHYRGSGHSDRDSGFETIGSMREDAIVALGCLRDRVADAQVALVATRLGAFAAVGCAVDGSAPIVLWEPVVNGSRYLRETLRKRAFREIAIGRATPTSSSDLQVELQEKGFVDVLGYPISSRFHDSVLPMRLDEDLDAMAPRALLLLEIGKGRNVRQEYVRLVERLDRSGWSAQAILAAGSEAWWFAGEGWETEEDQPLTKSLLDSTASWLAGRFDQGADA
jgi:hypothetical protein